MNNKQNNPQYIFLFILDAVRKDHLSLYGYPRKTSPNIDKLAKQSDVYNWAFSPSSYTHAAIPSILTGKYPFEINNPFFSWQFSEDDFKLLNQIKKNKFKLSLFTAHISSSSKNSNITKIFDYVYEDLNQSEVNRKEMLVGESKNIINNLIKFIKNNRWKKNLVIVHLMEAHGPYSQNYNSIFMNDSFFKRDKRKVERIVFDDLREVTDETIKNRILPRYQIYQPFLDENGNIEDFNPEVKFYIAHYDMGIYTQDKELGRFFNFLKKKNFFDSSTITITSDHGELMGEDNIFFSHGVYTHPALINVPLIIKWPNQKMKNLKKENFSNQYLLGHILKTKKLPESKYLNKYGLLSFTSQSFSLIKDNQLIMFHNGKYHFSGSQRNTLFPIWTFGPENIIDNYLNLEVVPHLKIFSKYKISFKEKTKINKTELVNFLNVFLEINKIIYQKIYQNLSFIKEKEISEKYQNEIEQKNRIINQLNSQLAKIYSSKTWKMLYFYKKITSFLKRLVLRK